MDEITERIPNYSQRDIKDKIILNIRDISRTMAALYEGKSSQKRVLIILSEDGDISQRELTVRLGIKPASASELLTKLENNGLIERRPSKADRRTLIITLTDAGREIAENANNKRQERHEKMFDCFSGEEKEQLLSLLERLNEDWDKKFR